MTRVCHETPSGDEVVHYDFWRSSASYRVRIALRLTGIAHRVVPVDLTRKDHRTPEYLGTNPQGLVPALWIDGQVLTQSLAIIEYLHHRAPEIGLMPEAPLDLARFRAMAYVIAMEIHPICNLSVATHVSTLTGGGEQTRTDWMHRFISRGLTDLEALLSGTPGPFCHGARPGMVDCCLIPQLTNAHRWGIETGHLTRITQAAQAAANLSAFADSAPDKVRPPG